MSREKSNWPVNALVLLLIMAAFAVVGQGDYELELERENARLKAATAHCRLAAAMRDAEPEARP